MQCRPTRTQCKAAVGSQNALARTRKCPPRSAVVAYWDGGAGSPRFRRYYGQLFGLPLAVTAFNRWPMTSLYFDDASIMDWRSGKGGAQSALLCFASVVGSPFAPEKHQTMSQEGDFLGLWQDFTMTHHTGQVQFCFFLARSCLGQVPGGAPFSQRSKLATACTNRMQIRN